MKCLGEKNLEMFQFTGINHPEIAHFDNSSQNLYPNILNPQLTPNKSSKCNKLKPGSSSHAATKCLALNPFLAVKHETKKTLLTLFRAENLFLLLLQLQKAINIKWHDV